MTDPEFDFLPLRVKRLSTNGKRWYNAADKRRLVAACEQPGASIARLALRAQINANQLHNWIRLEQALRRNRPSLPRPRSSRSGVPSGNHRKFRHFALWNLGGVVPQDDAGAPETLLL
ncbi:transposase [Robbsia andropogonis]|uniref:transposase n=1 Tax=Robbsia andropogonis TaxID=28092 RepID=UPI0004647A04|nr:transposase [Robbsia andropogonis]